MKMNVWLAVRARVGTEVRDTHARKHARTHARGRSHGRAAPIVVLERYDAKGRETPHGVFRENCLSDRTVRGGTRPPVSRWRIVTVGSLPTSIAPAPISTNILALSFPSGGGYLDRGLVLTPVRGCIIAFHALPLFIEDD